MKHPPSDAIVFFGATGDLAYKQIFPALLGMVRDEGLNVPIIGMGRAGRTLDQLKARATDSLGPQPFLSSLYGGCGLMSNSSPGGAPLSTGPEVRFAGSRMGESIS